MRKREGEAMKHLGEALQVKGTNDCVMGDAMLNNGPLSVGLSILR